MRLDDHFAFGTGAGKRSLFKPFIFGGAGAFFLWVLFLSVHIFLVSMYSLDKNTSANPTPVFKLAPPKTPEPAAPHPLF
jgi:hypothetical protein